MGRESFQRLGEEPLADRLRGERQEDLAAGRAVHGVAAAEPVDRNQRGRGGDLLDWHDVVPDQQLEGRRLPGLGGEMLANRVGDVPKIELARDHAGQLGQPAAQPVPRRPKVALDQGVLFERAEQAEGSRAVDAELAGDLGPGAPAALGKQVQDGHRPFHRPHRHVLAVVAHRATLSIARNAPGTYDAA